MTHFLASEIIDGLERLGWIDTTATAARARLPIALEDEPCLLRTWLYNSRREGVRLNSRGERTVSALLAAGLSMRTRWPRAWSASSQQWLGPRVFISHASNFAANTKLVSLVSSQLGSYGRNFPQWPRWIDSALQNVFQSDSRLLIVPGTTPAEPAEQLAKSAGIPTLRVLSIPKGDVASWLSETLTELTNCGELAANARMHLHVSPPLCQRKRDAKSCEPNDFPLQDRLSIALADGIFALKIRPSGTVDRLLTRRLEDRNFPTGSVFIAMHDPAAATSAVADMGPATWLDRGGVGWWIGRDLQHKQATAFGCRTAGKPALATGQICCRVPDQWRELGEAAQWPYLCHCTRGVVGPIADESSEHFRNRVWIQAEPVELQPLEVLARICFEQRLRASSSITRTSSRCVSFSAVPLLPLLSRRIFRSHLGRWDWKPYGLLIQAKLLETLGTRPVIYGDEGDYNRLKSDDRPFFQPERGRSGNSDTHWSLEREWRWLGDLNLRQLPVTGILAFVRTRAEAHVLSRVSPWPVLWVE